MARPRKVDQLTATADELCDVRIVQVDAVRAVRTAAPANAQLGDLGDLFSALSDVTRLRIVAALALRELCVCDIAAAVSTSESAVSHHLRLLRQRGLVRSRRDGKFVYYVLDDAHVTELFRQGLEHVAHRSGEGRP